MWKFIRIAQSKYSGWYGLDGGRSVGDNLALFRVGDPVLVGLQLDFLFGRTGLERLLVGKSCHYATDDRSCPVDLLRRGNGLMITGHLNIDIQVICRSNWIVTADRIRGFAFPLPSMNNRDCLDSVAKGDWWSPASAIFDRSNRSLKSALFV